jgi:hypothetical protein
MKQVKGILRDQRGNMTVFVLTIFFFITLIIFNLMFNMSTIFVDKEVAANSAQQAAIGATQVVYEEMKEAIDEYDLSIIGLEDWSPMWPQVETTEEYYRGANPSWSDSEVRYHAIDDVLSANLLANPKLRVFVWKGMEDAKRRIPEVAGSILSSNGAIKSESGVNMFNRDERIEVQTSVRYESETLGLEFLSTHREDIEQSAEGRRIGFINALGWIDSHLSL